MAPTALPRGGGPTLELALGSPGVTGASEQPTPPLCSGVLSLVAKGAHGLCAQPVWGWEHPKAQVTGGKAGWAAGTAGAKAPRWPQASSLQCGAGEGTDGSQAVAGSEHVTPAPSSPGQGGCSQARTAPVPRPCPPPGLAVRSPPAFSCSSISCLQGAAWRGRGWTGSSSGGQSA